MSAAAPWSQLLDDAERRDPLGHAIHLGVALLFLLLMPIGTAPANILSLPLLLITLLRWRAVGPIVVRLLRWPPVFPALALAAWMALSLSWSEDPRLGSSLLAPMRVLLIPACLAPLLARRELLGGTLLAGILLEAAYQSIEYASNRLSPDFDGLGRFGGFFTDPGKASLWDAIGVCGGVALLLTLPRRWCVAGAAIALLSMMGVIASGTRRQLAALAVVLPIMALAVLAVLPARRRRVLVAALVVIVGGAALWPIVGTSISTRVRQTIAQLSDPQKPMDDGRLSSPVLGLVHFDLRAFYWRASIDAWKREPFTGCGLGGTRSVTASHDLRPQMEVWLRQELTREYPARTPEENEADLQSRLVSTHPHSTWLQLLAETGVVGFVLGFVAWALAFAGAVRSAVRSSGGDPVALASAATLGLWAIGALFDASINSTTLGAVAVAAALGIGRSRGR
ncbi:MAG: O-antigen ligase family protein [Phycisphaerae bacterium]|nr:O-antigen ligase family protein [Phycisphaerae bacterium]